MKRKIVKERILSNDVLEMLTGLFSMDQHYWYIRLKQTAQKNDLHIPKPSCPIGHATLNQKKSNYCTKVVLVVALTISLLFQLKADKNYDITVSYLSNPTKSYTDCCYIFLWLPCFLPLFSFVLGIYLLVFSYFIFLGKTKHGNQDL